MMDVENIKQNFLIISKMNKFFYNKIITRNQVIVLNKKHENVEAFRNYLSDRVLKLKPDEGTRNTIYLDYLTIIYKFCLSKLFSAEKISTLLSIGIYIFNESLEKKLPMMESYQLLKSFVDLHDSQREPFFIGMFKEEEKLEIMKLFRDTFYRHYLLYEVSMTVFIDYTVETASFLELKLPETGSIAEGQQVDKSLFKFLQEYDKKPEVLQPEEHETTKETEHFEKIVELNKSASLLEDEETKELVKIKTPEDIKLETALESALKSFYGKLEAGVKDRDEILLEKVRPASRDKGKKPPTSTASAKKK